MVVFVIAGSRCSKSESNSSNSVEQREVGVGSE